MAPRRKQPDSPIALLLSPGHTFATTCALFSRVAPTAHSHSASSRTTVCFESNHTLLRVEPRSTSSRTTLPWDSARVAASIDTPDGCYRKARSRLPSSQSACFIPTAHQQSTTLSFYPQTASGLPSWSSVLDDDTLTVLPKESFLFRQRKEIVGEAVEVDEQNGGLGGGVMERHHSAFTGARLGTCHVEGGVER